MNYITAFRGKYIKRIRHVNTPFLSPPLFNPSDIARINRNGCARRRRWRRPRPPVRRPSTLPSRTSPARASTPRAAAEVATKTSSPATTSTSTSIWTCPRHFRRPPTAPLGSAHPWHPADRQDPKGHSIWRTINAKKAWYDDVRIEF